MKRSALVRRTFWFPGWLPFLLRACLCMMAFSFLAAQQPPGGASTIKVKTMLPRTSGNFALGEKLLIAVEYSHHGDDAVGLSTIPHFKGAVVKTSIISGSPDLPKGTGSAESYCLSEVPAQADEIQVNLWSKVTRKNIATLKVPVQITWGDDAPASGKPPAQGMPPGAFKVELSGYEVSQDIAAALFLLPMADLAPDKMVAKLSPLVPRGTARLVKLPELNLAGIEVRGTAALGEKFTLEAMLKSMTGNFLELIFALIPWLVKNGSCPQLKIAFT